VTITATLNGVSTSARFTVLPTALKSLQFTPWAVSGRILRAGETGGRAPPRPNMRGIE